MCVVGFAPPSLSLSLSLSQCRLRAAVKIFVVAHNKRVVPLFISPPKSARPHHHHHSHLKHLARIRTLRTVLFYLKKKKFFCQPPPISNFQRKKCTHFNQMVRGLMAFNRTMAPMIGLDCHTCAISET